MRASAWIGSRPAAIPWPSSRWTASKAATAGSSRSKRFGSKSAIHVSGVTGRENK